MFQYPRPFALFPNQTNFDIVSDQIALLESKRDTEESQETRRLIHYLILGFQEWQRFAVASPSLRTLSPVVPQELDSRNKDAPYAWFREEIVIDQELKRRKCIRLNSSDILVKVRTLKDKLILGSLDEYVAGQLVRENNYTFLRINPKVEHFAVKNFMKDRLGRTQEDHHRELTLQFRLKELQSPYILPVYHYLEVPDRFMAILPLVSNGDLFDLLQKRDSADLEELKPLMLAMLKGVGAMHAIGFCHRDISPENFLVKDAQTTLIMDFGLSAAMDEEWRVESTGFVGKRIYAAPEVNDASRRTYDGRKVDVWSLGITYFVLVTRVFPWNSLASASSPIWKRHWEAIAPYLQSKFPTPVGADFIDLLGHMLTIDPATRSPVDELLEHSFFG
jgi:serine/threonine protein kinase